MKKTSVLVAALLIIVFISCKCTGGNKSDSTTTGVKEGVVNQMSKSMFLNMVYNYEKNPAAWKFEGKQPCVIDFYADWCRPCKMVAPIMEELAAQYKGEVIFFKVNTDQERELSMTFSIKSIPSVMYVPANGNPQMSVGVLTKDAFIERIKTLLLNTGAPKQ
jgi:thioredoxin 1